MIRATYTRSKESGSYTLTLTGHAGAAENGQDIICSAASILAYTLAQAAQRMYQTGRLKRKHNLKLEAGDAVVTMRPKDSAHDDVELIYRTIFGGYELLAHNFPQFVETNTSDKA